MLRFSHLLLGLLCLETVWCGLIGDIVLYHSWESRNCVLCFNRRLEIYGEAEYVVSQSVYRHFAYPILYFAKGYSVVPRLRYSLGYAFFMLVGR